MKGREIDRRTRRDPGCDKVNEEPEIRGLRLLIHSFNSYLLIAHWIPDIRP